MQNAMERAFEQVFESKEFEKKLQTPNNEPITENGSSQELLEYFDKLMQDEKFYEQELKSLEQYEYER